MPDLEINPFQQIYNKLWELLEAHTFFTEIVRKANRIKFDTEDNLKAEVSNKDLPEVVIGTTTFDLNYDRTSSSSSLTKRFEVLVSSGSEDLTEAFFQTEWEIIRAFASWRDLLPALTWDGDKFVTDARLISGTEGLSDSALNRGIQGWTAILAIEVDMWFTTTKLRA